MPIELWVAKNTLDHFTRVAEPNLIFCGLPLRQAGSFRQVCSFGWLIVVAQAKTFPGDISKWDGMSSGSIFHFLFNLFTTYVSLSSYS